MMHGYNAMQQQYNANRSGQCSGCWLTAQTYDLSLMSSGLSSRPTIACLLYSVVRLLCVVHLVLNENSELMHEHTFVTS